MNKNIEVKYFLTILTILILALIVITISINLYTTNMAQDHIQGEIKLKPAQYPSVQKYSWFAIEIVKVLIIVWPSYLLYAYYKKKISRKFLRINLLIQLGAIIALNIFSSTPAISGISINFWVNYSFIKGYALALAGYMIIKIRE